MWHDEEIRCETCGTLLKVGNMRDTRPCPLCTTDNRNETTE